jgi:hypothetical protein
VAERGGGAREEENDLSFEDVRFFPNTNLTSHSGDGSSGEEGSQRQNIITKIRESIAVILLLFMSEKFVTQECGENLHDATVSELCDA